MLNELTRPNPTPTLPMHDTDALNEVMRSIPNAESIHVLMIHTNRYRGTNMKTLLTAESSNVTPFSLVRTMALGCCICSMRVRNVLSMMSNLSLLIPPVVEPAQAHIMEKNISTLTDMAGHTPELAVANPVVEITDASWNVPYLMESVKL